MYKIEDYLTEDGRVPFKDWLLALTDRQAKARILTRVQRMSAGNLGDCKPLQEGVWELRIDHGTGYRIYYAQAGKKLLLLLIGGDKTKQQTDINKAVGYWKDAGTGEHAMSEASRPHDQTVIELLREDSSFADEYLSAALDEVNEPGGREALLFALRHIVEAHGMATIAERAGIKRESLYRALSPKGNPTIKTLLAVISAVGLKLSVHRQEAVND